MVKLTIPEIPPSLNVWCRWHNQKANKEKQRWSELVWACALEQIGLKGLSKCNFAKAEVTLKYFFPNHNRRDPDNYSGKFILDGLVSSNVLVDDSFENVDLKIVKGGVDKQNPRCEIEIREVG
jgi:Holliday junction resolvase RusA-like endonuclease